jgi:molybdopterin/thiamine biosynthesis adenylyltransferase
MATDRFDRQNRVYGIEGTAKLQNSKVIIFGQKSDMLFETAKNLVLGGVNTLYIVKDHNLDMDVVVNDSKLSDSYEINFGENDNSFLGNIHNHTYCKLASEINKLNPYLKIELLGSNTQFNCEQFYNSIFVFINYDLMNLVKLNIDLRYTNKFVALNAILKDSKVVFKIMNDFNNHIINDVDGETYDMITLLHMLKIDDTITVTCNSAHNLSNGDLVKFALDNCQENPISKVSKIINQTTFECSFDNDISGFKNGYIQRIKQSMEIQHTQLSDHINIDEVDSLENLKKINPVIQYFLGALVSSEVVKAITNKYVPFNQTYEFDFPDYLTYKVNEEMFKDKTGFIVGSGAIGCELLKNLASIGFNNIKITDPDHIEVSNLSRQFLFRNENVGQSKSEVAGNRIKQFNPDMNIHSFSQKLGIDNQEFVNIHFPNTDIIFNALDNLTARLYVDSKCVEYCKPLFESGTLGTKGNTQPVIPNITESYGASQDSAQETSFAVCTIKNFPTLIQHTIHYAMDDFNGLFTKQPQSLNTYLTNQSQFDNISDLELGFIKLYLHRVIKLLNEITDFKDYIGWAYMLWYDRFVRRTERLLKSHPSDSLTSEGTLFWSHGKRCPIIPEFNISSNFDYIMATTQLLINTYKIDGVNIPTHDITEYIMNYDYSSVDVNRYIDDPDFSVEDETFKTLPDLNTVKFKVSINVQEFEKDLDTNYHIAYIHGTSNLRARLYGIPEVSFYETKGIAGKIIPALATTTSIVSSLIVLEMMKYVIDKNRKIEDYQSYFINLADNMIIAGEPMPPKINKINGQNFTEWSKFESNADLTIKEFVSSMGQKFNTNITMVTIGRKILYADFDNKNENNNLKEMLKTMEISGDKVSLFICSDNEELELPSITVSI